MKKTNKKGTSLVELLAVIVIMGIIAAIAVPTVGALLKNTRQKAAVSDLQQVVSSIETAYTAGDITLDADNKITYNPSATTADEITAYFGDDAILTDANSNGTITFTFTGSKVSNLDFSDDFTYTKSGKDYKFNDGAMDAVKGDEQ